MLASRVGKTINYVIFADRDKPIDEQTTFVLKTLGARARAKVTDRLVGTDEDQQIELAEPGSGFYAACEYGVDGWSNLRDEDGKEVPCLKRPLGNHTVLTEASMDMISDAMAELGAQIMLINRMADEEGQGRPAGESSLSSPTSPPIVPASPAS